MPERFLAFAKERGRNRVYVHDTSDTDFAQRRSDMHWVTRLTDAFEHGQLQLYRQPIVAVGGSADSARHHEILLRLDNGSGAPIGPGTFLPAAERSDVILKIDRWVLSRMSSSEVDYEMVRFTNEISHMMGRRTIAEYVTDPAIMGTLQAIGVDYAQGFWVGEPRPLDSARHA